ncbi:LAFA_0F09648g1_1 [Lachancea sp. 'fantastica']|nr:LAFA_0F09648g1_1 [Lachancea sp. 'fantastica']
MPRKQAQIQFHGLGNNVSPPCLVGKTSLSNFYSNLFVEIGEQLHLSEPFTPDSRISTLQTRTQILHHPIPSNDCDVACSFTYDRCWSGSYNTGHRRLKLYKIVVNFNKIAILQQLKYTEIMLRNRFGAALRASATIPSCYRPLGFFPLSKRSYSEDSAVKTHIQSTNDLQDPETQESPAGLPTQEVSAKPEIQPWYLNVGREQLQENSFPQEKIELPKDAPESLQILTAFLSDELGLVDILIFQTKDLDDDHTTAVAKFSDYIVLASAKSGKHCYKSFVEVNTLLKQKFQVQPHVEGNISANELRRRQRRLARHTNLSKSQGSRPAVTRSATQADSWYLIDCRVDNIFLNIMSDTRRQELNLEELYAPSKDKHLYRRQPQSPDVSVGEDDDNVLAGLKRLVARNQKRFYSTVSEKQLLTDRLLKQDFQAAERLTTSEPSSLSTLKTISGALQTIPADTTVQTQRWLQFFNSVWSPQFAFDTEYWHLRSHLLKLLNCCGKSRLSLEEVFANSLQFKLASGNLLTKEDLLEFLQLADANIQEGQELAQVNKIVVRALQLYKGIEPELLLDTEIICQLFKTMNGPHASLESLNGMIDFICAEFPSQIPVPVIDTVLQSLAKRKEYMKALKFWENGIILRNANDYRPWSIFVNMVAESRDVKFIRNVLNGGHLLWIKRNNVIVGPELGKALESLFDAADPNNIAYTDLREYLTQD